MNKQELIEKLTRNRDKCFEEAKKYAGLSWDPQILDAKALVYMQVINWVEQLDEQPKVTVPKFVADWIKQCKEKATLADCLNGYYQISNGQVIESEDFQNWVVDNENDELTAKAWMFGYEVEKEPIYEVIIDQRYLVQLFSGRTDARLVEFEELTIWSESAYKLTEETIKSIDERYWAFAVPVEEDK